MVLHVQRRSNRLVAKHQKESTDTPQAGTSSLPTNQVEECEVPWPPCQHNGDRCLEILLDACSSDDLHILVSQMEAMSGGACPKECTSDANGNIQQLSLQNPCKDFDEDSGGLKAQLEDWVFQTVGWKCVERMYWNGVISATAHW